LVPHFADFAEAPGPQAQVGGRHPHRAQKSPLVVVLFLHFSLFQNVLGACQFGYTEMYSQGGFMKTTVFRNGGSQAIRIPAQFRFEGDSVDVEWDDRLDALVIRELAKSRMYPFFKWLDQQPTFDLPMVLPMTTDGRIDVAAFMELDEEFGE
jgi:virulence-associated protein VagC